MKRIGIGRFASALMTALKRSSKSPRNRVPASSAPVSSEKTSAPSSRSGTSSPQEARRQTFGKRRLADAGVADEYRIVLAAAAQDLHRPLQLVDAADQRIELAGSRARRQVGRVGGQRVAGRRRAALTAAGLGVGAAVTRITAAGRRRRHLRYAVSDVLEDVEPRDALRGEQLRRVRPVLLQRRRDDVAGMHFLAAGALDVQHRRLQHAPERQRLLRLLLLAARELLDGFLQILVEVAAQLRHVGAAGSQDPFAVGVVRQGVEEVLERQVRMTTRRRLPVGDGEDNFKSWTEHCYGYDYGTGCQVPEFLRTLSIEPLLQHSTSAFSIAYSGSIAASSGNPVPAARSITVATLVSATSCG